MKVFSKTTLSQNARIKIFLSVFLLLFFIGLSYSVYIHYLEKIKKDTDVRMTEHLNDLTYIVDLQLKKHQIQQNTINSAVELIYKQIEDKLGTVQTIDSGYINIEDIIDIEPVISTLHKDTKDNRYTELKTVFNEKKYFESGYPFVVDKRGKYLIHPTNEGMDVSQANFFQNILNSEKGEGIFSYRWPDDRTGTWKKQYFKYLETNDIYVAITFDESDMYTYLYYIIFILSIAFIIALSGLLLILTLANREFTSFVDKLAKTISLMAKGHLVEKIEHTKINEIWEIVEPLNILIDGLRDTGLFSSEIGKGNLNAEFTPLSNKDVLGNSLLEMRQSLVKANEEEKTRKNEDDMQRWATNGITKFSDILRQDNNDMERLSYNVISNLVNYLDVNQGGMFIINDEDEEHVFFDMKAAFAYNQRKHIERQLDWGVGLIGRAAQEKQTIYLTEIPEDYINITSGLGEANPKYLLVVPLIMNDEVHGVIEIASFKEINHHQIELVEKVAESIASTISVVKINIRTADLLRESEKQAKRLEQQEEEMRQNLEELQATQEEAAKNEEAALGFVNAVNHTIIRADYALDGTLKYVNTKMLDKLQYNANDLEGKHYSTFIPEKDRKKFDLAWNELAQGGKHYEEEVEYITKYGKIWLLATYTPVRDNRGRVVKILFLAIDISNEKKKNLAFENDIMAIDSSIFKAEYDLEGNILNENEVLLNATGYKKNQRVGKSLFDIHYEKQLKGMKLLWSQLLNGISTEKQELIHTKDDKEKWFKGTYTPVKDSEGNIYKIIYIANDITAQKKLEIETKKRNEELIAQDEELKQNMEELTSTQEKMHKSEMETRGIIHAIDVSTFAVEHDLNGDILSANEAFCKAFGIHANEIVGKNDKDFTDLSSKEKLKDFQQFWEEIKFGIVKSKVNKLSINGREYWLNETYTPILDENKRPFKILKIAIDITKTKELELEAQKQTEALQSQEEELRQNLEELQSTRDDLEDRLQQINQMQEELTKEKYLLDTLLDNIPEYIYFKDNKSKFLRVSKSMATLFHVNDVSDIVGKSDFDFQDRKHAQKAYKDEQEIIRTGKPVIDAIEKTSAEGSKAKYVSTTKMPIIDQNGEVVGTFGISKDISEIKQLEEKLKLHNDELTTQEEELRQNLEELHATQEALEQKNLEQQKLTEELKKENALMEALLGSFPDSVYFKDKDSKFMRISKSMLSLFKINSEKEVIGKSDFDFQGKEHAQQAFNDEQQIIRTGIPIVDLLEKEEFDDGRQNWVSTTKMPLKDQDGNIIGTFGISRDITSLKTMEFEIKQQNEELLATEEELRQNLEELEATQDDLNLRMKENMKMHDELEKEKNLLDALLDNIPDSIYFKDKESKFMRISKSMLDLFKVNSSNEIIGKSDFDFQGREHAQKAYKDEQEIIRTRTPLVDLLEKEEYDDGRVNWVSTTKMPLIDKEGNVVGTFGISRNITKIKQMEVDMKQQNEELLATEEELRQNLEEIQATQEEMERMQKREAEQSAQMMKTINNHKRMLMKVIDNIPGRIYVKDGNGKMLLVNNAVAKLHGMSADELIGKSNFDLYGENKGERITEAERNIKKSGPSTFMETETVMNSNSIYQTTKMPFYIAHLEQTGILSIQTDVTEIKQKELELLSKNTELEKIQEDLMWEKVMFHTLMDNMPDRITFKDANGKFKRVNKAKIVKLNLKNENEIIGMSDFDFFPKEHAEKAFKKEQDLLRLGKSLLDIEEKLVFPDGTVNWGSTSRIPFAAETGEIIGSLIITKDITSIKLIQADIWNKDKIIKGLVSKISAVVYKIDTTGKIVEITGSGIRKLKSTKKQLIGKQIADIYPQIANQVEQGFDDELQFVSEEKDSSFEHAVFENNIIENELNGYALEINE